jgi:hypothetical protein
VIAQYIPLSFIFIIRIVAIVKMNAVVHQLSNFLHGYTEKVFVTRATKSDTLELSIRYSSDLACIPLNSPIS